MEALSRVYLDPAGVSMEKLMFYLSKFTIAVNEKYYLQDLEQEEDTIARDLIVDILTNANKN